MDIDRMLNKMMGKGKKGSDSPISNFNFNMGQIKSSRLNLKPASIAKQKQWFNMSPKTKAKMLGRYPDTDRDGVPDRFDCQPMNPFRDMAWNVEEKRKQGFHVVPMSPDEYIQMTGDINFENRPDSKRFLDTQKGKMMPIKRLTKMVQSKDIYVGVPYIEKGYGNNQEGKHRAYAAKLGGEKIIPVIVPRPKEHRTSEIAGEFIQRQFPGEHGSYKREWEERFNRPFPEQYMNEEGVQTYKQILQEKGLEGKRQKYYHGTTGMFIPSIQKEGIRPAKELPVHNIMSDETNPEYTYFFKNPKDAKPWAQVVTQRVGLGKPKIIEADIESTKVERDLNMPYGESYKYKGTVQPYDIREYEEPKASRTIKISTSQMKDIMPKESSGYDDLPKALPRQSQGASIEKQQEWKEMPEQEKAVAQEVLPDKDGDGTPDCYDCQPENPKKDRTRLDLRKFRKLTQPTPHEDSYEERLQKKEESSPDALESFSKNKGRDLEGFHSDKDISKKEGYRSYVYDIYKEDADELYNKSINQSEKEE